MVTWTMETSQAHAPVLRTLQGMKNHVSTAVQQLVESWGRRSDARASQVAVAEVARNQRDIDFARCAAAGPFIS